MKDGRNFDKSGRWTSMEDKALVQEVVAYLASYGLKSQPPVDLVAEEVLGWEKQMEKDASSIMDIINTRPSFPSTEPHTKEKHQQYPHCDQNIDIDLFDSVVDASYDGDSIQGLIETSSASPGTTSGETGTPDAVSVTDRVLISQFTTHSTLYQQNVTTSPPTWAFAQLPPAQTSPTPSQSLAGELPMLYTDSEVLGCLNASDHASICEPRYTMLDEPYLPTNSSYLNAGPLSNAEVDRSRQMEQQLRQQFLTMPLSAGHVDCVSTTPACLTSLNVPPIPGAFVKAAISYKRQDLYQPHLNHSQVENTQCNHAISDLRIGANHALLPLPAVPALSHFSPFAIPQQQVRTRQLQESQSEQPLAFDPLYSLPATLCESTYQHCSSSPSPARHLSSMSLTVSATPSESSPQPHFLVCDAPLVSSPNEGTGSPADIYSAVLYPPTPLSLASSDCPTHPVIPKTSDEYSLAISRAMSLCPWSLIATRSIPGRTGVQAQARWSEALDPQVKKGPWSQEEDALLLSGVRESRKCWIWIADTIPGRTQRQCRTRWVQLSTKAERRVAVALVSANEQSPAQPPMPAVQDEGLSPSDFM
ncbi:hypothetical protein BGZ58_010492 [Dissophora ornata]|nr:hypothetical protein BGZ58_010492 [Dissophora ornata]